MDTVVTTLMGWGNTGETGRGPAHSESSARAVSIQRCVRVTDSWSPLSAPELRQATGGWNDSLATRPGPALVGSEDGSGPARPAAEPGPHEFVAPANRLTAASEASSPSTGGLPKEPVSAQKPTEGRADARAQPVAPPQRLRAPTPHPPERQGMAAALPDGGSWGVLLLIASLVLALFVGAALLSAEVTVKAPGTLRAPNGLRSVGSVLSGAVTDVLVHAGDEVTAGQLIARLEETQLRASLTLREQELADARRQTTEAARADAAQLERASAALQHQRLALQKRRRINEAQLQQRIRRLDDAKQMLQDGVTSAADTLAVRESVQAAAESMAMVGSQAGELELQLADRRREWKQRELERASTLNRAVAAVEEARSVLDTAEVRSPARGHLESLVIHPGTVVEAGTILAQIVPDDAPRSIVAFVPSREMAFVRVGTEANVEVESLPVNEFGMARARVDRISADIAKPEEIAVALGEQLPGSFVRVELTMIEDEATAKMAPHLRSGERLLVRLHRRDERVLGLIFEFTRKWLAQ